MISLADSILIIQFATTQDGTLGQNEILKIKDFKNNPDNPLFLYIIDRR